MQIGHTDGVLDGNAGPFGIRLAVQKAPLHAAAEHHDGGAAREVAVQAVVLQFLKGIDLFSRLVVGVRAGFAFDHHVATEFAGDDDERSIEQPPCFEVED